MAHSKSGLIYVAYQSIFEQFLMGQTHFGHSSKFFTLNWCLPFLYHHIPQVCMINFHQCGYKRYLHVIVHHYLGIVCLQKIEIYFDLVQPSVHSEAERRPSKVWGLLGSRVAIGTTFTSHLLIEFVPLLTTHLTTRKYSATQYINTVASLEQCTPVTPAQGCILSSDFSGNNCGMLPCIFSVLCTN